MTSNIVTPQGYKSVQDGLPNGWIRVTIGEISRLINSGFPSGRHNQEQIGVPHLRPMNVSPHGTIDLDVVKYVELEEGKQYDFLVKGDVLFNNTNSPDWLGKTAFIESDTNWVYSNHMTRIRLYQEIADSAWVAYALHNLFNTGFFRLHCRNHVNQASINAGFLANEVQIPLAPLAEQKRIVDAIEAQFTRLDAAVAGLRRLRANLQRYRQSVLKAACEGRLVPTEAELARAEDRPFEDGATLLQRVLAERRRQWEADNRPQQPKDDKWKAKYREPAAPDVFSLPELPDGWSWATVEQVGKVQLGRQRAPQHHNGPHMRPYLRVANVFEDRIDTSDVMEMNFSPGEYEKFKLEYGDILLNEGQSPEFLGRPAMYRGEVPGSCFQNTLIRFKASSNLLPKFALTMFRSYMHNGRFRQESQITTNIAHLSAGRFATIEFPLPPLAEQERIVEEVERRLSVIEQHEQVIAASLKRAERLRQSILKRAFAGQLVAQDPNDEPA